MQNNNIMNLFGFKDVVFDSFNENNEFVHVHAYVSKMSICPHCGSKRIWVHDHRVQMIRDTHICDKKSLIHLKKTRYDCKSCGCRFERKLDFIAKGHTMTKRLVCVTFATSLLLYLTKILCLYHLNLKSRCICTYFVNSLRTFE